jgi:serine/threonine protein kinase
LGIILYEQLTGRTPFQAGSVVDTIFKVMTEEPTSPTRLQPNVPRDLETICLKCLKKEPHQRYASAEDLADDLRRFQTGEPILARPMTRSERLLLVVKRRWRVALALGFVAAMAVTAVLAVSAILLVWLTPVTYVSSGGQPIIAGSADQPSGPGLITVAESPLMTLKR